MAHAPTATRRRLERLTLITTSVEAAFALALEQRWRQHTLTAPLTQPPQATTYRLGFQPLGLAVPLVLHGLTLITRKRARRWPLLAAVATLAGGYALRSVMVSAGNVSAT